MEVESKFNPEDWNGYLHTYENIQEYNAAKKLLPHVARIESTREAKYIPKEELENWYLYCDDIRDTGEMERVFNTTAQDSGQWLMEIVYHNINIDRSYKLLGKIEISGDQYYLWELCDLEDNITFNNENLGFTKKEDDIRYLLTSVLLHITDGYAEDGFAYTGKALTTNLDVSYSRGSDCEKLAVRSQDDAHPSSFIDSINFIIHMYEV